MTEDPKEQPPLVAIDPGNRESAFVVYAGGRITDMGKIPNRDLMLRLEAVVGNLADVELVLEMIQSFGMPVGAEIFETVVWIGRFMERWLLLAGVEAHRLPRGAVKMHLCRNMGARDPHIRAALIDRFGGGEGKAIAIGKKASPGPLYGVSNDVWSALALAVTFSEKAARSGGVAAMVAAGGRL